MNLKIPRTWWTRFILVSSAEIWFTFFNFQILIILSTHSVWFSILAHITHTCEARRSIKFARAVNKTITWYGSYFKDTVLQTANFSVHLGDPVQKFSRITQVTCIFCTVAHEEDWRRLWIRPYKWHPSPEYPCSRRSKLFLKCIEFDPM
jgi:hypothetical protein